MLPPAARPTARAPLKASPAPVVSTASTGKASKWTTTSPPHTSTPCSPSVMITVPAPRSTRRAAARRPESRSCTSMPVSAITSPAFGVR